MVSKTTKSIASRIPLDLFFQIKNEADEQGLNLNDYLLKIIQARNAKPIVTLTADAPSEQNPPVKTKAPKKKKENQKDSSQEILFPEM